MNRFKKLLPFFKNKFVITSVGVILWLTFFDKYDLISQYKARKVLIKLEQDKKYYTAEIKKNQEQMLELKTNAQSLEKFAREKYLMKKDDEDIFLIFDKTKSDTSTALIR